MRIGKVKATMLSRSVLKPVSKRSTDGSPAYGEDAGTLRLSEIFKTEQSLCAADGESSTSAAVLSDARIAIQVNPVEGWWKAPERAVYGAINSLAAAGAEISALAITILMPLEVKEKQLKSLMNSLARLCEEHQIVLIAGHTAYSAHVDTLMLSVTGIGTASGKKSGTKMQGGLDLILTGYVGSEGAARIAWEQERELSTRFMNSYIEQAQHLYDDPACDYAARILYDEGAVYLHDLREGGLFAGLWELASSGSVGLDIELKKVPIRQHTIEVCEYFNMNPYMLYSGGCLLAATSDGSDMVQKLSQHGINAAIIGHTTEGNDRIVRYDDEIRYLEPPKPDEYFNLIIAEKKNI